MAIIDLPRARPEQQPRIPSALGAGSDDLEPSPTSGEEPSLVRLNLVKLSVLVLAISALAFTFVRPSDTWLNWYLTVAWSIYVPMHVLGLFAALHRRFRHGGLIGRSTFAGKVDKTVIFVLPTLCRDDTTNALKRVVTSIVERAPQNLSSYRIDVVTEEGMAGPNILRWLKSMPQVRVLTVPKDYRTPRGAKFKARANHYALELRRREGENTRNAYVYHLDDDTHVGQDTISSIAEFIHLHHGQYFLAQGVLTFPRELTPSRFCWLADSMRPGDDITRFAFFTGVLRRPLAGLHGEHLLIRGDIEDSIGWDFPDTVVEDAHFGLEFARRYKRRATMLNSFSYGASPASLKDLIRQRRRWAEGLLRLMKKRSIPLRKRIPLALSVLCGVSAPFQQLTLVLGIAWLTGIGNTSPVVRGVALFWAFGVAFTMWQYSEGLKINIAASEKPPAYWWQLPLCMLSLYVFVAVESFGALLGFVRFLGFGSQKVSEVISKPI